MSRENYEIQTHTIDSLKNVTDSLQITLEMQTKEYDRNENRYKDIIAEYTYGMEWIKLYHPSAYKDFHRIIAYKERYSRLIEQENKQRLNINE